MVFTDQILPVCIPENSENFENKNSWTTGWGALYQEAIQPSRFLMELELPILSDKECEKKYYNKVNKYLINATNFLCGRNISKGPCFGDSGGPLVVKSKNRWVLAGITSWAVQCGDGAVYTRITNYIDWIKDSIISNYSFLIHLSFSAKKQKPKIQILKVI